MRNVWLVLALVACGTPEEEDPCAGDGDLSMSLGEGTQADFVTWEEGEVVLPSGGLLDVSVLTTGIDTTDAVTAVYRTSINGGDTEDFSQAPFLECDGETGWHRARLDLGDVMAEDLIEVTVIVTDPSGDSVEDTVEVEIGP